MKAKLLNAFSHCFTWRKLQKLSGGQAPRRQARSHQTWTIVSGGCSGQSIRIVGALPVLDRGSAGLGGLALNLDLLGLVCAELASNVGLLGGSRGLGKGELLDLAFSVGGLDGGGLVSLELAEV